MSYKEIIFQLDTLVTGASFGIKNLSVVQAALAEDAVGPHDGSDALYVTYEYLKDLHDQMATILSAAIKAGREHSAELEVAV